MWGIESSLLNNISYLRTVSMFALAQANATIVNHMDEQFSPTGVTVMFLLKESSFDIHTYPERGFAAINIHTCGTVADPNKAIDFLIERLKPDPNRIYRKEIVRGVE